MDEFKIEGGGETSIEGLWCLEAAGVNFRGIELGRGAEFLHRHRAYRQLLAGQFCKQIDAVIAHHAEPVGEVCGGDVLAELFAHVRQELVHVGVRFVGVVAHVVSRMHVVNRVL